MSKRQEQECEELPSGKVILRKFNDDGQLTSESHGYGMLDVAVQMDFEGGVKIHEMYFSKQRMVGRARYEKLIKDYPDMPSPDDSVEDFSGNLIRLERAERRRIKAMQAARAPNPKLAAEIDSFCESLLAGDGTADAVNWIEFRNHILGEYTITKGRNLIKKLVRLGAVAVHACDIDIDEEHGEQESGMLVVELPTDAQQRASLLKEIDRIVRLQGLHGNADEGQRFESIKLD